MMQYGGSNLYGIGVLDETYIVVDYNDKKIFVGNLPFSVENKDLTELFAAFGKVIGVNNRLDRVTNKPKATL